MANKAPELISITGYYQGRRVKVNALRTDEKDQEWLEIRALAFDNKKDPPEMYNGFWVEKELVKNIVGHFNDKTSHDIKL